MAHLERCNRYCTINIWYNKNNKNRCLQVYKVFSLWCNDICYWICLLPTYLKIIIIEVCKADSSLFFRGKGNTPRCHADKKTTWNVWCDFGVAPHMYQHHACTNGNNVRSLRFTQMCGINSPKCVVLIHQLSSMTHMLKIWMLIWVLTGIRTLRRPVMNLHIHCAGMDNKRFIRKNPTIHGDIVGYCCITCMMFMWFDLWVGSKLGAAFQQKQNDKTWDFGGHILRDTHKNNKACLYLGCNTPNVWFPIIKGKSTKTIKPQVQEISSNPDFWWDIILFILFPLNSLYEISSFWVVETEVNTVLPALRPDPTWSFLVTFVKRMAWGCQAIAGAPSGKHTKYFLKKNAFFKGINHKKLYKITMVNG